MKENGYIIYIIYLKFITKIEGHINKTWTNSETISVVKGNDSSIEINGKIEDNVGTWKFY